ncbi:MAG TPA: MFS transporter [Burkholderiaceae bacterium]|jgi:predicted MFS family arabinose efflux permease
MSQPIDTKQQSTYSPHAIHPAIPEAAIPAVPLPSPEAMPAWMTFLLAAACGLIVANLYFAQPLISLIAADVGLDKSAASLIVTLTQGGYCAGLLLLVPLGDLIENRRLIVAAIGGVILALVLAATAPTASVFLVASLLIGVSAVAVQMLVPLAAHMAQDATRGSVVGNVMSGLLLGIMLSRPISSFVAHAFGWRAVFGSSAGVMVVLLLVLRRLLPQRRPDASHTYPELIGTLWILLRDTPILRRRAAYHAALFASFTLYWTIVPLLLAGPYFNFTQSGIGFFALTGAAGVLSAPLAGRMADRGWSRIGTGIALAAALAGFAMAHVGARGALLPLLFGGVLLDLGVQANLVLGQRAIYALGAHTRSRLNGLFMAMFFGGGAVGSAISSYTYLHGGWEAVSWIGMAFPLAAFIFYLTEFRNKS